MNKLYPGKSLREDVFEHLDMVFRSARRAQKHGAALKAIEIALKAKKQGGENSSNADLGEMSETQLEQLLHQLKLET